MNILPFLSKLKMLNLTVELLDDKLKIHAPEGTLTPDLIKELKDRKEEVVDFLRAAKNRGRVEAVTPAEKKEFYRTSSEQKRIYFLQQMGTKSTVYNIRKIIEMDEREYPSHDRLQETFEKLIRRHEALRTSFEIIEGELVQRVHENNVEFRVECHDIAKIRRASGHATHGTGGDRGGLPTVDEIVRAFVRPFDLARAPLARACLVIPEKGNPVLAVDIHHIVSDGVSHNILKQEFGVFIRGGRPDPLPVQYKDYAEWQNGTAYQDAMKRQESYWLNEFRGEIPTLQLPTDYSRPPVQSFEGKIFFFPISRDIFSPLEKMATDRGFTLFMGVLAAFYVLLAKLSGQEDIVVGIPTAGRNYADLGGVMGMFVNTLALRHYPKGTVTFDGFLESVGRQTLKAFENQNYPFQYLVEKVMGARDAARNPLFDVMLDLENMGGNVESGTAEDFPAKENAVFYRNWVSRFDMTWNAKAKGGQLLFGIEFSSKLFKEETVLRFVDYFKQVVAAVSAVPECRIEDIEIVSDEEKKRLLVEFNRTLVPYPDIQTVLSLYRKQAAGNPGKIAAVFNDLQLTYEELDCRAGNLAGRLWKKGVKPDTVVGIMVYRSLEMIIGVMGIQWAGGAFLPIDPTYPPKRIAHMLADSGTGLLLTRGSGTCPVDFRGEIIDISPGVPGEEHRIEEAEVAAAASTRDLAYVIYTSGSTGKPKGVMVQNHSYANAALAWRDVYRLEEIEVNLLQMASFSFDVFAGDLARALTNGGKLVICPEEARMDPQSLYRLIVNHNVSLFESTPALIVPLMAYVFDNHLPVNHLEILILGSDICPAEAFRRLVMRFGDRMRVINSYGVTEAAIDTSFYEESFENLREGGNTPIGKPLPNMRFYILDEMDRVRPTGTAGLLYIGGKGVARGYINNRVLTARQFLPDPFIPGERIYKTGDLAKWLSDGNVEFLGRVDGQVKVRGYRIEVGEIESRLATHERIKEAVVAARQVVKNSIDLCAYIVCRGELSPAELKRFLSEELPAYMLPAYFVKMDAMPLTPNGKVDRKALPNPTAAVGNDGNYVPPSSETESKLCKIWAEILGIPVEKIGVEDNFFLLGGASINLFVLISKIYREFNIGLTMSHLYDRPTVRGIAAHLDSDRYVESPVMLLGPSRPRKMFCFPSSVGFGLNYTGLSSCLDNYSCYGFNFIEKEDRLEQYVDLIVGLQPVGPYVLFGWSAAGKLIIQVTRALEERGHEVSDIIFADCFFIEEDGRKLHPRGDNKLYFQEIAERLKEIGVEFLEERVLTKARNYDKYFDSVTRLDVVNANIHLVLSRRKRDAETLRCWDKYTTRKYLIYQGFGEHTRMFDSTFCPKNAEVIGRILDGIDFGITDVK